MKVILLKDVAKIGRRFEIAEVPDGYAMNMLLPKGMAETATPENLKRHKARTEKAAAEGKEHAAQFEAAVAKLKDTQLTIQVGANEQGHMFEALKPAAIVAAAEAEGVQLTEAQVVMAAPIKETGKHDIVLKNEDQSETISINVVAA